MAAKIKDFFQKMTIFKFLDKMDKLRTFFDFLSKNFFRVKNFSDNLDFKNAHNLIKKVV